MTKYGDFKELVKNQVGYVEPVLTADICYGMGLLRGSNAENIGMSLSSLDDAYDEVVWIRYNEESNEWIIYAKRRNDGHEFMLGSVSNTYRRYQIATMLADLYLTFYQNCYIYNTEGEP